MLLFAINENGFLLMQSLAITVIRLLVAAKQNHDMLSSTQKVCAPLLKAMIIQPTMVQLFATWVLV